MPESKAALDWLNSLPLAGYDIQVLLKNNSILRIPWCRISSDGRYLHLGKISKSEECPFPIISTTKEILISKVAMISFLDDTELRFLIREKAPD